MRWPMKINDCIISIPPHISTTWDNILSLSVEDESTLVITLLDGSKMRVPHLEKSLIEKAFSAHVDFVEKEEKELREDESLKYAFSTNAKDKDTSSAQDLLSKLLLFPQKEGLDISLPIDPEGFESMGIGMQHNPSQKNSPKLPSALLKKISNISKVFGEEKLNLPSPESGCNCFYCQVARALQPEEEEEIDPDAEVSDTELKFRLWDVKELNKHTFLVSNPLDKEENYKVHLKEPIGCTCGGKNCPHLKAVLES